MIDLRYVKKLIDIIDESTVDSIEITSDKGLKIRISKSPQQRGAVQVAAPMPIPTMVPAISGPGVVGGPGAGAGRMSPAQGVPVVAEPEVAAAESPKSTALDVKSPMVGTFYKSPEPGSKPYVVVGDRVKKGQILCIIEAMKIMNEIESEFAGVVREILVEDAQPVEYGQALFRIDPNG